MLAEPYEPYDNITSTAHKAHKNYLNDIATLLIENLINATEVDEFDLLSSNQLNILRRKYYSADKVSASVESLISLYNAFHASDITKFSRQQVEKRFKDEVHRLSHNAPSTLPFP